jgi:hypothetical protein
VAAAPLSGLGELDAYKAVPFPTGYPHDQRTFYSPVDRVHDVLVRLTRSAQQSLVLGM